MAKIIQINGDIVTVGMDSGSLTEVRMCDLNFTPNVNDEVDIFQNESKKFSIFFVWKTKC